MEIRITGLTKKEVYFIIKSSSGITTRESVISTHEFKDFLSNSGPHLLFVEEDINLDDLYSYTEVKIRD